MPTKNLLIIKASSDICAAEVDHLKAIAEMFNIRECVVELRDLSTFHSQLCSGQRYDYIYVGAHANAYWFGDPDRKIRIRWPHIATAFCDSDCLNPGAILLLGCCRGGLKKVASQLFLACDKIDYVCGPRWTVRPADISAGVHIFLYNMEFRREQPSTAVERASKGTGYDFFCHDRIEMEDELERPEETLREILDGPLSQASNLLVPHADGIPPTRS